MARTVVESLDTVPKYSADEERTIAQKLRAATQRVHEGGLRERPFDVRTLCELHESVFGNIVARAGSVRARGEGTETLQFGPNRSVHRDDVTSDLAELFRDLSQMIRSLDDNRDDPEYFEKAFHIAVWAHAQVVRIHPFEDGNGRSSRLLLDAVLVRAGLPPAPAEFCKPEYNECLNSYFRTQNLQPLIDLFLAQFVPLEALTPSSS